MGGAADAAAAEVPSPAYCHGCFADLAPGAAGSAEAGVVLRCPVCRHLFCFDCDAYIHEHLHNCPGCEAAPRRQADEDTMDVG